MNKEKITKGITLTVLIVSVLLICVYQFIAIKGGEIGVIKHEEKLSQSKENEIVIENNENIEAGTIVQTPINWVKDVNNEIEGVVDIMQVASVYAVATGNGESVPVPKGFYYVGGTINSGVVISDNKADQNKYLNVANGDVPAGVAYNSDGTVNVEKSELKGNQFVWIPVSINEYKKKDWGEAYSDATWEKYTNSAELAQIEKYGGFYIGRYEAGVGNIVLSTGIDFAGANTASDWQNDSFSIKDSLGNSYTGKISSKAGEIPYYHADYETALKLSNAMYKTDYVQSGLVTGTQWDVMLKFIAGNDDTIVTSSDWGNYNNGNVTYMAGQGRYTNVATGADKSTSAFMACDGNYHYGIKTTAISENVKKKNLYDIAGNLWEWTQEGAFPSSANESYMLRGGSFNDYQNYPCCKRRVVNIYGRATCDGFRPVLYIK